MKMKDVFSEALRIMSEGEKAALSTVVSGKGSLPMSRKAKMLVRSDGEIIGTVGGGCLEAEVWAEAKRVMDQESASLQSFTLTEKRAGELGLSCGGTVEIFTEPILPGRSDEVFEEIVRIKSERGTAALATLLSGGGSKMVIKSDGKRVGSLGDDEVDRWACGEAELVIREDVLRVLDLDRPGEEGRVRVFLEAIIPEPTLFLFGGGHISLAVSKIAKLVGFRLVVVDDRPAFANFDRFPEADEVVVEEFDRVFDKLEIDEASYIVSVTRGHMWDERVMERAVWTKAKYIGMIGSRRKIAMMWDRLESKGVPRALSEGVHAPIGLDINADTPEEIAVSIVAELIEVRREH